MGLKEYRQKRKFSKTPEPEGKSKSGRGALRFVIQKHAATRMHFDFRIELDGVFKSWAVPRGPSLSPLNQRLAVRVEDHPIEYGSFEGVIPKGNYGAGTVMVWDSGTFEERNSKGRKASSVALEKGLAEGKITIVLKGKKLSGEFALVRIKGKDPKAWLLIKKRDSFARDSEALIDDKSVQSGRTMQEIAAQSEKRNDVWLPGKGKATAQDTFSAKKNKAMPHHLRAMQGVVAAAAPKEGEWIFERSINGHRAIAELENGKTRIYSRGLLALDKKFPKVAQALSRLKHDLILDGEILGAKYFVFDLLYLDGKDLRSEPLSARRSALNVLNIFGPVLKLVDAVAKPPAGAYLAKKQSSVYRGGISRDWLILKADAKTGGGASEDLPPLHNLDKIFWPAEGFTKGDVVRYYDKVAAFILPHLVDRPQSLHRQPDGLRNEGFFQKDMTGYVPRRIETIRVHSKSADKTINYLLCQDRWTLLYLANLGCIELNPWLSRKQDLQRPDFIVIDIDPDENDFEEVVEVALEVKKTLGALGVESWCKTSGASGLHVCVPVRGRYDYEFSRIFAEGICRLVNRKLSNLTSVERTPAKRRGKIYLDFLQNRRGQTLAAPYCLRARPGGTVSAPLRWSEVNSKLRPQKFTLTTMPARLARVGDLWKPVLEKSLNLDKAMSQLSKLLLDSERRKR